MRLYQQLVLFMLAATVLPLAVVGFYLLRGAEAELSIRIGNEQRARAMLAAEGAAADLLGAVDALARSAEAFDWVTASDEEKKGGLALLYQQSPAVSAVALVNASGELLMPPVFLAEGGQGHDGFDQATGVAALQRAVPLAALSSGGKGQAALSAGYPSSRAQAAALAVAVKLSEGAQAPFALAELSLSLVEAKLSAHSGSEGVLDLVDGEGNILASSQGARRFSLLPAQVQVAMRAGLQGQASAAFSAEDAQDAQGGRLLMAAAKLPVQLGMYAVSTVRAQAALAPVRALRKTVLLSVGAALGVLLVLGALFTRRLNRRLSQVVAGAEAFAQGELSHRIALAGSDELTELAQTFNRMGGELSSSRAKLLGFNDELRQRVDEATFELKAAQEKLVEAQKLAAVGQLGAGVAHEINNPLAGILGNAQLLLMDRNAQDADFESLRKIEQSAKRCKEITQNLLRFSQQQQERPDRKSLDLNAVVRAALGALKPALDQEGVELLFEPAEGPLPAYADSRQISQVLHAVVQNSRTAMTQSPKKALTVRTAQDANQAVLRVEDSGKGIRPEHLARVFEPFFTTKDVWSNVGLGLSLAYRMVAEHQGRIEIASEPGSGTAVTVRLPSFGAAEDLGSLAAVAASALERQQ